MPNVVQNIINNYAPGTIFSAYNFNGTSSRNTIDQSLSRLAKRGYIQKIAQGLFRKPKINPFIGAVPPMADELIQAYSQKFGYQIQFHPAKAANMLGLSEQVVAQNIYLTNAPNKILHFGDHTIQLKHVCPCKLLGIGTKAGLIIQSLYYFGKNQLTEDILLKIKHLTKDTDTKNLLQSFYPNLPYWMQSVLSHIGINPNVH